MQLDRHPVHEYTKFQENQRWNLFESLCQLCVNPKQYVFLKLSLFQRQYRLKVTFVQKDKNIGKKCLVNLEKIPVLTSRDKYSIHLMLKQKHSRWKVNHCVLHSFPNMESPKYLRLNTTDTALRNRNSAEDKERRKEFLLPYV